MIQADALARLRCAFIAVPAKRGASAVVAKEQNKTALYKKIRQVAGLYFY